MDAAGIEIAPAQAERPHIQVVNARPAVPKIQPRAADLYEVEDTLSLMFEKMDINFHRSA